MEGPKASSWCDPRRSCHTDKKNLKKRAQKELTSPPLRPFPVSPEGSPPAISGWKEDLKLLLQSFQEVKSFYFISFLFYEPARKLGGVAPGNGFFLKYQKTGCKTCPLG